MLGNDFNEGTISTFTGSSLGECNGFDMGEGVNWNNAVTLLHSGETNIYMTIKLTSFQSWALVGFDGGQFDYAIIFTANEVKDKSYSLNLNNTYDPTFLDSYRSSGVISISSWTETISNLEVVVSQRSFTFQIHPKLPSSAYKGITIEKIFKLLNFYYILVKKSELKIYLLIIKKNNFMGLNGLIGLENEL